MVHARAARKDHVKESGVDKGSKLCCEERKGLGV